MWLKICSPKQTLRNVGPEHPKPFILLKFSNPFTWLDGLHLDKILGVVLAMKYLNKGFFSFRQILECLLLKFNLKRYCFCYLTFEMLFKELLWNWYSGMYNFSCHKNMLVRKIMRLDLCNKKGNYPPAFGNTFNLTLMFTKLGHCQGPRKKVKCCRQTYRADIQIEPCTCWVLNFTFW